MKHLLLLLYSILFVQTRAGIDFQLYYNFNHCANCNAQFDLLKNIDPTIKKTFFFTKNSQSYLDEFLKDHDFKKSDYTIQFVNDNFFECKKINCVQQLYESYCLVFYGEGKKDSFLLKELSLKLKSLLNATALTNQTITLPDSITLSDRFQFSVHKNIINFLDETLNKNVTLLLNPEMTKIEKALVIKRDIFKPSQFLNIACFDTTIYRKFYPVIKSIGKHVPAISKTFITDSTINLMLSFSYPEIINTDSNITMKLFLFTKSLRTNQNTLFCLQKDGYSSINKLPENYTINNIQPFLINSQKIYFSIAKWEDTIDRDLLAEYELKSNQIDFKKIIKNKFQSVPNKKRKLGYDLNRYVNSDFYFTNNYPYFFNYKTNEQFVLDEKDFLVESHSEYFIIDVLSADDKLFVLVVYGADKKVLKFSYDSKSKKIINKKEVKLNPNEDFNYLRFINSNTYLNYENKKIRIFTD